MEELLFGLTPAEWWVWSYLVLLAERQGSGHVILPKPGEDLEAEKVMTRRHLKNILKSLRAKFRLTNLIIPRSKSKRIEVLLPASKIGVLNFRNVEKGEIKAPNKEALGAQMSPITTLGKSATPISAEIQATLLSYDPRQAKLKEVIERLLKLSKQGDLKWEIASMGFEGQQRVYEGMRQLSRYEPKSKKLSQAARIYAMVRFMQAGEAIDRPQAWIDKVGRAAERELKGGKMERCECGRPALLSFSYGGGPVITVCQGCWRKGLRAARRALNGKKAHQEKMANHHPQGDQAKTRAASGTDIELANR